MIFLKKPILNLKKENQKKKKKEADIIDNFYRVPTFQGQEMITEEKQASR